MKAAKAPKIDCFYVYPTVSDQPTANANLTIDPVERSIALYQAARYSQDCRVFAPMYRQVTLARPRRQGDRPAAREIAYATCSRRGTTTSRTSTMGAAFVLIGHSQGTFHAPEAAQPARSTRSPALRKRLISAILLGGNVLVKKGKDVGGDFKHVPACRSDTQLGCVVAFSSFDQVPPADSKFGRTTAGLQVLCTNPASLHGGSGPLDAIEPTQPFAAGSIALGIQLLQLTLPKASTPFLEVRGAFKGHCSTAGGASFLSLSPQGASPTPKASPDPTWGLHLVDGNIALGNLVSLVQSEAAAYAKLS